MYYGELTEYEEINLESIPRADVCVECIVYNQKDYVKDMLEGIVRQKTEYTFFALVIDDASTDGTSEIIKEYAKKNPGIIKALIAKDNTFGKKPMCEIWDPIKLKYACNVDFIATCEGDDCWTDVNKLQVQIKYMKSHKNCMMYLHNSWWYDCQSGEKHLANPFEVSDERDLSVEEIIMLRKKHPATASRMYRKELLNSPDYVKKCSVGDYNVMLYAALIGKVHYSNKAMCIYRYMSKGSTSQLLTNNNNYMIYHELGVILFLLNYDKYSNYEYHIFISPMIRCFWNAIAQFTNTNFITVYRMLNKNYCLNIGERIVDYLNEKMHQELDDNYMMKNLKKFILSHKSIVIFGAGKYAEKMTRKIQSALLDFNGYVVSKQQDKDTLNGKPVWVIDELPFNNDVGIIVSVVPKDNDGVMKLISETEYTNVICPYDFILAEIEDI